MCIKDDEESSLLVTSEVVYCIESRKNFYAKGRKNHDIKCAHILCFFLFPKG